MAEKLNVYNYLNIVAFGLSWVLNSSVADGPGEEVWYFNGIQELRREYESIVTPIGITYLMAHLVLLLEGVFTVAQLLPKYRSSIMVQESIQYLFIGSAVAQFIWSILLGMRESILASLGSVFAMGALFVCITKILMQQAAASDSSQTPEEYWLLRFPFSVHFGWALSVFIMAINGFVVQQLENAVAFQLVLGFISLAAIAGVGYKMLFMNGPHPNYAVPAVLSWVLFGIALEEQGPKVDLEGIAGLIFGGLSGLLGVGMTGVTAYLYYQTEHKNKGLTNEDDTVYVTAPEGNGAMA